MNLITLGLGSNIHPEDNITRTTTFIESLCTSIKSSSRYHSPSRGFDGADFINTVMICETNLSLDEFRSACHTRELSQGKIHNSTTDGYHDRSIDIDILFAQDSITSEFSTLNSKLFIPHPRLHLRDFVLIPLQELLGDIILPHTGKRISEHLIQLSAL